jgi:hypothetical protein
MRIRAPLIAIALGSIVGVIFAGCGIESYLLLQQPFCQTSGNTFIIQHNSQNNSSSFFSYGYDIYYKLYLGSDYGITPPQDAVADIAAIAAASSANTTPDVAVTAMKNSGFVRMYNSTKTSVSSLFCFIPVSRLSSNGISLTIMINNNPLGSPTAQFKLVDGSTILSQGLSPTGVSRIAPYGSGYRPFSDFTFDPTDCDTKSVGNSPPWIVIYTVAFAFQEIASEPYYCEPLCISYYSGAPGPTYIGNY